MKIGIPKEIMTGERRVAANPETVKKYIEKGYEVLVEAGAGLGSFSTDEEYAAAGAKIMADPRELYNQADIILKVKQPVQNEQFGIHEVDMMKEGAYLITFLHPAAPESHDMVRKMRDRNITSFTMDGIPRITRAQRMDALTSMSTCTGYRSVLQAATLLPKFLPMVGTAIGAIKPAEVLVIGTGVVGLQAVATAKRLGAIVRGWDIRPNAKQEAGSLGAKVDGFDVPEELAIAPGGYAKTLPKEWLLKEREALAPFVEKADVIILSALVPGSLAPILITEDMVKTMKNGSVIVDVSIDQGGNCAISQPGKEIVAHGVTISAIQNIPGRLAVHSTWLYANNMVYFLDNLFKKGPTPDFDDEIVKNSLVTMDRKIHFKPALEAMGEV
ncbi:MAG TPA: NAD(P) transhydrogenase subunit alpha [Myxococcota bacterium]|nr:NAD(P) transhydrogenase subunit alpha [Myxococcota bacterium]